MNQSRLPELPTIDSVMTASPWYAQIDDTLEHALEVMNRNRIRHLPVKRGEELVGVVSAREVSLLLESAAPERRAELTVREACPPDSYVVAVDEPLAAVLEALSERHIGSALVTREGRLVGILTTMDACRCFSELLRSLAGAACEPQR